MTREAEALLAALLRACVSPLGGVGTVEYCRICGNRWQGKPRHSAGCELHAFESHLASIRDDGTGEDYHLLAAALHDAREAALKAVDTKWVDGVDLAIRGAALALFPGHGTQALAGREKFLQDCGVIST